MVRKWIVTAGGLGLLPAIPGTYASAAAAAIHFALWLRFGVWANLVVLGLAAVFSVLSVLMTPWAEAYFRKKDPRCFVLDEFVGQWVALLFIPLSGKLALAHVAAAFFLFRAFDVAKPYPVRDAERLPGGWGVLLDDVMAGVYANIGVRVLIFLVWWLMGSQGTPPVI